MILLVQQSAYFEVGTFLFNGHILLVNVSCLRGVNRMSWLEELEQLVHKRLHGIVGNLSRNWDGKNDKKENDNEQAAIERKLDQLKTRNAEIVKAIANGQVLSQKNVEDRRVIDYLLHQQFLVKQQKEKYYLEEQIEPRQLTIRNNQIIDDILLPTTYSLIEEAEPFKLEDYNDSSDKRQRYHYDRRAAVQYAERWWNSYNPKYKKFEVDCTNYVSQCLHAGGIPMTGFGNRSKGWWYSGKSWSYSWAVANALRWHLSGAKQGIRAQEVASARELVPGDILCYDFEGDGKWNHNTIVVAKDANNEPLVNAHTYNSRMRYWAYKDSTAYTPNIKYKFFHILDRP